MIKNLIFDFGDVLINLDKQAVPDTLQQWGHQIEDAQWQQLGNRYEKGRVETDEFLTQASKLLGTSDHSQLIGIWNQTIRDFPNYRLAFLEDLAEQQTHRMFLLSNTNELHIEHVKEKVGKSKYLRLQNCFEGFYLSYEIGMRKPEPEIFRHVLGRHGLVADETLFIDDTIEHVLSAASLGMHTWHLKPEEDVVELLNKF